MTGLFSDDHAAGLDAADPLRALRAEFLLPRHDGVEQAYFCGKPNPLMMRTGLRRLGCHSAEAVMVGDRMDTDVISGMECGMSTVLVLSGISTEATLDEYAYRPSAVLDGVGDIVTLAEAQHAE